MRGNGKLPPFTAPTLSPLSRIDPESVVTPSPQTQHPTPRQHAQISIAEKFEHPNYSGRVNEGYDVSLLRLSRVLLEPILGLTDLTSASPHDHMHTHPRPSALLPTQLSFTAQLLLHPMVSLTACALRRLHHHALADSGLSGHQLRQACMLTSPPRVRDLYNDRTQDNKFGDNVGDQSIFLGGKDTFVGGPLCGRRK